jgi:UDP-3-O-[3-hydroxymyristoyl] glucosamine N-acyltransferase
MAQTPSVSVSDLADRIGGVLHARATKDILITGVNPLQSAGPGSIVYVTNNAGCRTAESGQCAAVIASQQLALNLTKPVIIVEDPRAAWIHCLEIFAPVLTRATGVSLEASIGDGVEIDPSAVVMQNVSIMPGVRIGARTRVWPGVFLGEDVQIGQDCIIYPNVVIRECCILGSRVILHPGAVIGADGFGYQADPAGWHKKIPQIGNVIIEDDVEIGANATVDRSTCGSTVIGVGSKIDNLVQIAHNVSIGKNNILAAQTGIAGSSTTGTGCIFAGQSGLADHCRVGDRAVIGPQAGVQLRRLKADTVYFGTPAIEMEKMQKILPIFHRLPELLGKGQKQVVIDSSESENSNSK